ncbi:MAG: tetratricopeptide repeat protein, partial [Pseudorhodoplanes sp.]|nr:tetratricopeptide repeat protein [Pseudorhodoplanes sp.]
MRSRAARALATAAALGALLWPALARAQAPVQGDVRVSTEGGYARIVFHLAEEVESVARLAGGIVVVHFRRPVELPIERINHMAPDYVGAARRDPDGRGLRIALARKVTLNSMAAGDRIFLDLLPESWSGPPPGLPQEVIEELARRARDAEKLLRAQRANNRKNQKVTPVRVAVQPTFTRYVFDLPDIVAVSTDRNKDTLTVSFGAPVKYDLADAKATLPSVIRSIDAVSQTDTTTVRFSFAEPADVRSFREDNSYVVDVSAVNAQGEVSDKPGKLENALAAAATRLGPLAGVEAPTTVPAKAPLAHGGSAKPPESAAAAPQA